MLYRIRRSAISDTDVLGRVCAQCWRETYNGILSPEALAVEASVEHRTEIRRKLYTYSTPDWGHFLAEAENGEVVGHADCGPADSLKDFAPAEIYTLYVLRSAQKKGLGARLFSEMVKHLAERNFESAVLDVFSANMQARRFYEAKGGKKVGEINRDFNGTSLPLTVYVWSDLKKITASGFGL